MEQRQRTTKQLAMAAVLMAAAVVGSTFSVPIFGSKCAPVQHLVNILCAVLLGPWWGVGVAFGASLIRNVLGLGTLLAFPGSMFGALLAGLLYHFFGKLAAAYIGELFGTAVLGGLCAYPIAAAVIGIPGVALFTFVIPFLISSVGGTLIAMVLTVSMQQTGLLERFGTLERR